MRLLSFIAIAALVATPVAAQSVIRPDGGGQPSAPNAQAAQRPLGPNARAAVRPVGPNMAIVRESKARSGEVHYPSCSAMGVVRSGPVRKGESGYGRHLDPDGDGIACD